MYSVCLSQPDDFEAWRDAARKAVIAEIPPDQLVWQAGTPADLFSGEAIPSAVDRPVSVPRTFFEKARHVFCHRDPERFALLYTLLWQLQAGRTGMNDASDPLVQRVDRLARSVRRDIHKMRAFVRFRELDGRFVAWFEPEQHIVRANAGFFVRRFSSMRWSILTPEISVHWDGETLLEAAGARKTDAPSGDPLEEMWKAYYRNIFNPARVKIGAMTKEMPRKYWKNMPETSLIPELIETAQAREAGMIARPAASGSPEAAWQALRDEAASCTRCALCRNASQTVFGEGPVNARLLIVGEQPGDIEDIAGRPFVGPAGKLLDRALAEAGIDRQASYVTNAVKHFKYEQRGKRRVHASPNASEIDACRWWIEQEQAIIRPAITLALGATAARSLLGRPVRVGEVRGRWLTPPQHAEARVTVHPSFLLRLDGREAAQEYERFVEDLSKVAERLKAS